MIGAEHETSVVTTGTEALSMLMREPDETHLDLILCDLHMPEISGMDLYKKLSRLRPGTAERMVFMTGGAFTERSRDFISRVKNQCIDKPIDLRQLRQLVTTTLIRRQS
jgi:CheY-like chemotaxis protein